jgi:glycosyltransferase involved in cell wall biosynthesis
MYENESSYSNAFKLAMESDVTIFGVAPEIFVRKRLKQNKLTFRYQERIFKNSRWRIFNPKTFLTLLFNHTRYNHKKLYMLCASAYTAGDYKLAGAYLNKCFKWGYFPSVEALSENIMPKTNEKVKLLWAGRLLKWKHPELAVFVSEYLVKKGYDFQLDIIGTGSERFNILKLIEEKKLKNNVTVHESMPPEKVRKFMQDADIFLFTSDKGEGWGVVLNEAMSSGCAVVANNMIGSVPYLLQDGHNGLVYTNNNLNEFCTKVEKLISDENLRHQLSINAYSTVYDEWNPQNAASKLLLLINDFVAGGKGDVFSEGVLSKDFGNL